MRISEHALRRLDQRVGWARADDLRALLLTLPEERGTVAYILARLDKKAQTRDGSNGDLLIAIAVDGSADTVYLRRSAQGTEALHARKVVDLT